MFDSLTAVVIVIWLNRRKATEKERNVDREQQREREREKLICNEMVECFGIFRRAASTNVFLFPLFVWPIMTIVICGRAHALRNAAIVLYISTSKENVLSVLFSLPISLSLSHSVSISFLFFRYYTLSGLFTIHLSVCENRV